jgi:cytochrome c2
MPLRVGSDEQLLALDVEDMQMSGLWRRMRLTALAAVATALCSAKAVSVELGDARRGRDYAAAVCAKCHAIAPGDMVSPRLAATPFAVVSDLPGMNRRALAVFLQTPHAEMPNLVIVGRDLDDLISYLLSLSEKQ